VFGHVVNKLGGDHTMPGGKPVGSVITSREWTWLLGCKSLGRSFDSFSWDAGTSIITDPLLRSVIFEYLRAASLPFHLFMVRVKTTIGRFAKELLFLLPSSIIESNTCQRATRFYVVRKSQFRSRWLKILHTVKKTISIITLPQEPPLSCI
jgi:hypothetical protein